MIWYKNQELFYFVDMDENGIKNIYSNPEKALNLFLKAIGRYKDSSIVNEIRSIAIREVLIRMLPIKIDVYSIEDDIEEDNSNIFTGFNEESSKEDENLFI